MTAYLRLQLVMVALSGVLAVGLWLLTGRLPLLRRRTLARCVVIGPLGFLASAAATPAATSLLHRGFSGFATVALVFHALWFWLPLCLLVRWWRARAQAGAQRGAAAGWALVGLPAFLTGLWAMFVEPDRLVVHSDRIEVAGWGAEDPPLRIVHISDLQTVGECARERAALELIAELEPDLVVFTGDLVAGPLPDDGEGVAAARAFVAGLRARLGVVIVDGHCESEATRDEVLAGLDVIVPRNEAVLFDLEGGRRLRLVGFRADRADLRLATAPPAAGEVILVASHIPDVTLHLPPHVALHLAGHTHGGQIVVPGFGAPITLSRLPRETARGTSRRGLFPLHVSAGIGMEGGFAPRIRMFCPPEVCLLELVGSDAPVAEVLR